MQTFRHFFVGLENRTKKRQYVILNYTTYKMSMLYNFFMVIISILNLFVSIILTNMLFCLVGATINKTQPKFLMFVLSVLGGVVLATLKILLLPRIGVVLIALVLFGCSSVVLFYPQKLSSFIILQVVSIAYILLANGVSYAVQLIFFNFFEMSFTTYLIYSLLENITILLMGGFVFYLFKLNYRKKEITDFVYDCLIEIAGRRIKLKMFLDSGNMLFDPQSGRPIIIVNKHIFESKLGCLVVEEECRKVSYATISGEGKELSVFEPDNIFIVKGNEECRVDAMVGVVEKDFKIYDGLLHSSVI